jgi:hypothetical protein
MVIAKSQEQSIVDDGVYPAQLTGIKEFSNVYGPRIGFEFTLGGKAAGNVIMRSTAPQLTPKSKLADVLQGLTGKNLDAMGSQIDLQTMVGTQCQVLVRKSQGKNGKLYSNVEQVFSINPPLI